MEAGVCPRRRRLKRERQPALRGVCVLTGLRVSSLSPPAVPSTHPRTRGLPFNLVSRSRSHVEASSASHQKRRNPICFSLSLSRGLSFSHCVFRFLVSTHTHTLCLSITSHTLVDSCEPQALPCCVRELLLSHYRSLLNASRNQRVSRESSSRQQQHMHSLTETSSHEEDSSSRKKSSAAAKARETERELKAKEKELQSHTHSHTKRLSPTHIRVIRCLFTRRQGFHPCNLSQRSQERRRQRSESRSIKTQPGRRRRRRQRRAAAILSQHERERESFLSHL